MSERFTYLMLTILTYSLYNHSSYYTSHSQNNDF